MASRPEVIRADDPPEEATAQRSVSSLRSEVERLKLGAELAALKEATSPTLADQVTALAEIVGRFQADLTNLIQPLEGAIAALDARVAAMEKA